MCERPWCLWDRGASRRWSSIRSPKRRWSRARGIGGTCALSELLARFDRVRVAPIDFDHCVVFAKRYSLSHGVGWPDCLIAATALRLGLPVVTLNDKRFKVFKGLRVVRPY
ncbi:MAG TPA: PIN domain-containing protein [Phycisphaerales bacterium]|nr:PIN domain-containing protein [Phycisphaerales bacterium]